MAEIPFNKEANDLTHVKIFEALGRIETQTTKHNDRMRKIEIWRERATSAAAVAGLFLAFVIMPILCWGLWLLVKVQGEFDHPTTASEIAKELIELEAQTKKLRVDEGSSIQAITQ